MLTIEQEFWLKRLESDLEKASDRELRAIALILAKQNLMQKNVFTQMVKGEFGGESKV